VPDTAFKHLPHFMVPCLRLIETGRKLGLLDDQQLAAATIRTLERASTPATRGESTLVPAEALDAPIGGQG
jgi:hypothetical protein